MNKQLKVAHVIDEYTIAINAGSDIGIKLGQRYLLYQLSSEEILDPDTHESLGYLEIVKGTGKVTHLQEHMSTIKSDDCSTFPKKITRKPLSHKNSWFYSTFNTVEEETTSSTELFPFEDPRIGDLVKRIN